MRGLLAVLLACVCVSLVEPKDERPFLHEWEVYRSFLTIPACMNAPKDKDAQCMEAVTSWKRDFMWATDPSWRNQYAGQRNIATCLFTGCDGDVIRQPMLACAWSRVVLRSGHPKITSEDVEREEAMCSALKSKAEQDTANAQSERLLKMLGVN